MGVLNSTLWGEDEIPSLLSPPPSTFTPPKPGVGVESGGDGESLNSRLEFHNSEGNQWANMISGGVNLVMTVIGFAVSTMFIVFVCTRLVCARIQLNASRRSFPVASRSDLSILERGLHGLEPAVVANFPTKKFADEFFSPAEDAQ
ncbi:hypothetical protein CK203_058108 [Vitis vinifera]|uniref:Uncharacterized protein n=1 Tax=Vitis vinifera TaxID=29760 RepID=A0A438GGU7_VITVI|nr:hypothetical protein CK203_058108 [Vitis vinifera]